jgi:LmbE family N-acetylglucosaminyl deacetylase
MSLRLNIVVALIAVLILTQGLGPSAQTEKSSQRTILAVGAHAGDMEISCGAVLAKLVQGGDRVVMLHLTLGEGGNPRLSPQEYGRQKREEAKAAAASIGAEVLFGPYLDGEIPNDEGARRYVAETIRQVKPSSLITHWRHSIHKDHVVTSVVTVDAELLASLAAVKTDHPPYGGVKAIFFTENWEDKEGFAPYTYVDVTGALESWGKCAKAYEFIRGGISSFPYFEYYRALAQVRGAEAGFTHAVAFDIDPIGKKQMLRALP